jgi:hypothetical protein
MNDGAAEDEKTFAQRRCQGHDRMSRIAGKLSIEGKASRIEREYERCDNLMYFP